MKHAKPSRAWRSARARPRSGGGISSAFVALAFNACLFLLPLASAAALITIARDHLYHYEFSDQGARALRGRVERLNADLIQLDFDRRQQWDNLVAGELMDHDIAAARGFLLSGRSMLASRDASAIDRRSHGGTNDAEAELAAIELLTPGTRGRYEATVPLLSRRSASGQAQRPVEQAAPLGDQRDFELLARSMLADGDADPVQFVLTGMNLGLAGEFTPRMAVGASVLLDASRRPDYPTGFGDEIAQQLADAVSVARFRTTALATASGAAQGRYDNVAAAFRAAVSPEHAAVVKQTLDTIGAMAEAATPSGAGALLTHASTIRDLPRLSLIARAAGDRAAAAAKRLPRDGQLLATARGELTLTRDLTSALGVVGLTLLVLMTIVGWQLVRFGQAIWDRAKDNHVTGSELVDSFNQPWSGL